MSSRLGQVGRLLAAFVMIAVGAGVSRGADGGPAKIEVLYGSPKPLAREEWPVLPPFLEGGTLLDTATRPANAKVGKNVISATIKSDGFVLMAVSWQYDGNDNGGWFETRSTYDSLANAGWIPIARLVLMTHEGADDHILLRKEFRKGDTLQLHTRKQKPPRIFTVPAAQAGKIPHTAMALDRPSVESAAEADMAAIPAERQAIVRLEDAELTPADPAHWDPLPEFLQGAKVSSLAGRSPQAVSQQRELWLTVEQSGFLLVACSWTNDGNKLGDWFGSHKTHANLVEDGWTPLAPLKSRQPKPEDHTLFHRLVRKGDIVRFHTRKKTPPLLFQIEDRKITGLLAAIPVTPAKPPTVPVARNRVKNGDGEFQADVEVKYQQPVDLAGPQWPNVPPLLAGAKIYAQENRPKDAETNRAEIWMNVKSDGFLVLACSWNFDGHPDESWFDSRVTEAGLERSGWKPIGKLMFVRNGGQDEHKLYLRSVKAGEEFRFHTRKQFPPRVVTIAEEFVPRITSKPGSPGGVPAIASVAKNAKGVPQAEVVCRNTEAIALAADRWPNLPAYLKGGRIYSSVKPGGGDAGARMLRAEVKTPGFVLIAASWTYDGNQSGNWKPTVTDREALENQGWIPVGVMDLKKADGIDPHTLFTKTFEAGDKIEFHTRKKTPPYLILVPGDAPASLPDTTPMLTAFHNLQAPELLQQRPIRIARDSQTLPLTLLDGASKYDDRRLGALEREIVRQAFLLCAREQFGLGTRDAALREPLGDLAGGTVVAPEVMASLSPSGQLQVTVFRRSSDTCEVLLNKRLPLPQTGNVLPALVEGMEAWSRSEFIEALAAAGYSRRESPLPTAASDKPLPVDPDLERLDMFAQFGVVRKLHASLLESGESAEKYARLARAYVQLGSLTRFLQSPASNVWEARGLLYAQRGVRRQPEALLPVAHRALVWGIVGHHGQAALDLARANELAQSWRGPLPNWMVPLDALAQGDLPLLKAQATSQGGLAAHLELLAVAPCGNPMLTREAAQRVLKDCPTHYQALAAMATTQALGDTRWANGEMLRQSALTLDQSLFALPGLPDSVAEILRNRQRSATGNETRRTLDEEWKSRPAIIAALEAAPPTPQEPAWSALAGLLRDFNFTQAIDSIRIQKRSLGLDPDEEIERVRPLTAGHPLAGLADVMQSNQVAAREAAEKLVAGTNLASIEQNQFRQVEEIYYLGLKDDYGKWILAAEAHLSPVFDQCMIDSNEHQTNDQGRLAMVRRLNECAPEHPWTCALRLARDFEAVEHLLPEWTRRHGDSPLFLPALIDRYERMQRGDEALALRQRLCEVNPSYESYNALAAAYEFRNDEEHYVSTLKEFLDKVPSFGLDHATVCSNLAAYYMGKDDFDTALPYAERAADSYSAWGLQSAIRCYTGLKRFEEAERLARAVGERYDGMQDTWLCWCVVTGRGDRKGAEAQARPILDDSREVEYITEVFARVRVAYALGDRRRSLELMDQGVKLEPSQATFVLRAAGLAAFQKDSVRVQSLLKHLGDLKSNLELPAEQRPLIAFGELIGPMLLKPDGPAPDDSALTAALEPLQRGVRPSAEYTLGMGFLIRGDRERARRHFQQAAAFDYTSVSAVLSSYELEQLK